MSDPSSSDARPTTQNTDAAEKPAAQNAPPCTSDAEKQRRHRSPCAEILCACRTHFAALPRRLLRSAEKKQLRFLFFGAKCGERKARELIEEHEGLRLRLIFDGLITGLFAGSVSIFYRWLLARCESLRLGALHNPSLPRLLLYLLIFAASAFFISRLLRHVPLSGGSGIPQVEAELLGYFHMPAGRVLAAKISGGALANLAGQSLGREGPSIQISAAAAKLCARLFRRSKIEEKYMISSGAAAGLAAAFNAPLSAILFSLEEVHKSFSPYLVFPAMLAGITADMLSKLVFGFEPIFRFTVKASIPLGKYPVILLLGLLIGLIGILFNLALLAAQKLYKRLPLPSSLKLFLPFLACLPAGLFLPQIMGGGHRLLDRILDSRYPLLFLFLIVFMKFLFTVFCYGSGVQGGIFLPLLVIGGLSGLLLHEALPGFQNYGFYAPNFMILGMAGMMSAVVRAPLLSILLVTEMTGSFNHFLALTLVVFVAHLVAETLHIEPIYESFLKAMKPVQKLKARERLLFDYKVELLSPLAGKELHEIYLPAQSLVVSIDREGHEITPSGRTRIEAGDKLLILTEESSVEELKSALASPLETKSHDMYLEQRRGE